MLKRSWPMLESTDKIISNQDEGWILKNNKIYIIPTRFGILYFIVIIVMILTGATYSNNLIYLLGFFLFSVFVSGMVQTHNNIKGLQIKILNVEDCFEGEDTQVMVQILNPTKKTKQTIRIIASDKSIRHEIPGKAEVIEPHKSVTLQFPIQTQERGDFQLKKVNIYTNYPVGLFRSWMYQKVSFTYFVYPRPLNFSQSRFQLKGEKENLRAGSESYHSLESDFKEHRNYQYGESYRRIDWKAYARKRLLLVKNFDGSSGNLKSFDYNELSHLNTEQKLQQLSFWIFESKREKESFQLILPQFKLSSGNTESHAKSGLRALAIFSEKGKYSES